MRTFYSPVRSNFKTLIHPNHLLHGGDDAVLGTLALFLTLPMESEKAMAPHSSTLAWKIPQTEEPSRLQSMGSWRVGHDWVTSLSLFHFHALEKEMAPSCLENPRDGRAWWTAVYGVAQSWTQLKRRSSSSSSSSSSPWSKPWIPLWLTSLILFQDVPRMRCRVMLLSVTSHNCDWGHTCWPTAFLPQQSAMSCMCYRSSPACRDTKLLRP